MAFSFDELATDLAEYRKSVDLIDTRRLLTARGWQQYYSDVLLQSTKLYLSYLTLKRALPALHRQAKKKKADAKMDRINVSHDIEHWHRFRQRLAASASWNELSPEPQGLATLAHLHTLQDYSDAFTLHLPEIYFEALRTEHLIRLFDNEPSSGDLAVLEVGMDHLGSNHLPFVLPALHWASRTSTWS